MKNIALIGIGPHAKRIYLHYFKKKKVNLELVVDLESEKDNIRKYLDENGFKKTKIFTLSDKYKDDWREIYKMPIVKEKFSSYISEHHGVNSYRDILWEEDKKRDLVLIYKKG